MSRFDRPTRAALSRLHGFTTGHHMRQPRELPGGDTRPSRVRHRSNLNTRRDPAAPMPRRLAPHATATGRPDGTTPPNADQLWDSAKIHSVYRCSLAFLSAARAPARIPDIA